MKKTICNNCEKIFEIKSYKLKSNKHIFCSRNCYSEFRSKNYIKENNPNFRHGETNNNKCIDCGKNIWYGYIRCNKCNGIKSRNKERYIEHYCKELCCANKITYQTWKNGGGRCLSCAIKEDRKDPTTHYNWQNGKSFELYPLGWTKTFKEQIRFRDSYKCQICGKPEVENCKKLDVHHIDYDKENINPENLASACKSCHMKTNYNREYWIEYFKRQIKQEESTCRKD